jgi:uncharacterized membrane protein YgdD (TMEM256/DUF423 family)
MMLIVKNYDSLNALGPVTPLGGMIMIAGYADNTC